MAWLRRKTALKRYTRNAEFVFILGMHRSGTSCLAGSLERCGLFLGEVSRHNHHNIKGNYELRTAKHIHDQILTANGGTWCQPPAHIMVNRGQKQILKNIAGQLCSHQPCGLKDPRLLLLLDIWVEIVDSYALVGTFRHPVAVAESLAERNQIPEKQAYSLWLRYNTELVRWHQMYHFPLVEFELSDVEAYQRTIVALIKTLDLKPDLAQLHEFIISELDHYRSLGKPVPTVCQEMYAYLRRHCYQLIT